jgi:hypothetical protein
MSKDRPHSQGKHRLLVIADVTDCKEIRIRESDLPEDSKWTGFLVACCTMLNSACPRGPPQFGFQGLSVIHQVQPRTLLLLQEAGLLVLPLH